MLLESLEHAEEDVATRLLIEARVEAQRVLHDLQKALTESADLLVEGEKEAIARAEQALREAMAGSDHHRIEEAIADLDRASTDFARRRMEKALKDALTGRSVQEIE